MTPEDVERVRSETPSCRRIAFFNNAGASLMPDPVIDAVTRLLPGVLMRNASLHFVCRPQHLSVESANTAFTSAYSASSTVTIPIAHHDGNYFADEATLDRLEGEGRVVFRYAAGENPNGASRDIAGILSENGRVMGMMPHPERAVGGNEGGADGLGVFESLMNAA